MGGGFFPFIFNQLVRLWTCCVPSFSFLACLDVPLMFVWLVIEGESSNRLWQSFSLALAKLNNYLSMVLDFALCKRVSEVGRYF